MNEVYKTNKYGLHLSLSVKTNGPSVTVLCWFPSPLRKIAQLQSPRVHSFKESLSWPYIFVYYTLGKQTGKEIVLMPYIFI